MIFTVASLILRIAGYLFVTPARTIFRVLQARGPSDLIHSFFRQTLRHWTGIKREPAWTLLIACSNSRRTCL